GLRIGSSDGHYQGHSAGEHLQPGHERVLPGERFHPVDRRSAGYEAGAALRGRRTRLGRRQSVRLSGLHAHAALGMGAAGDDPTGDSAHVAISTKQQMAAGGAPMKPLRTETAWSTPWFEVAAKTMREGEAPFYSLRLPDYAAVVAVTVEGRIVIVRQYRPAVE